MDYTLFQMINRLAGIYTFLNPLMKFLAEDAQYLFYGGVIIYWFTRTNRNRRMVIEAFASACLALGFGGILALLFYRDRPFVAHHVIQLINHPANASFPSDHATGAFVIAAAIWMFRKKDGLVWLILAASISISRIWTGVHYPSDVVTGAIIGMVSAIFVHRLFTRWYFADKCMSYGLEMYEKIEQKIWAKMQSPQGKTR
ncbi:undecaprenyl-diphosphatase [Paenibacillus brasilensis]|uniref:Undecaprenyl-diphosphatase n=1 Tax=Paenibacillus brasilensis TaxID=128574 RepID=A0ABU0L725_9BACL|nr:undecaprenyl-diphosphatase [Paenibacillus brasilensis]MDQ0497066.1 undecaprenyl-diphosphatase [Paenibacillus brasilensis]